MKTHTPHGGYAPCGSALVITLLQKYRFPLSPSNTTPETDTHSVYTHPQKKAIFSSFFTHNFSAFDRHSQTHTDRVYIQLFHFYFHHLLLLVAPSSHPLSRNVQNNISSNKHEISSSSSYMGAPHAPVGGCVCLLTVSDTVREFA